MRLQVNIGRVYRWRGLYFSLHVNIGWVYSWVYSYWYLSLKASIWMMSTVRSVLCQCVRGCYTLDPLIKEEWKISNVDCPNSLVMEAVKIEEFLSLSIRTLFRPYIQYDLMLYLPSWDGKYLKFIWSLLGATRKEAIWFSSSMTYLKLRESTRDSSWGCLSALMCYSPPDYPYNKSLCCRVLVANMLCCKIIKLRL